MLCDRQRRGIDVRRANAGIRAYNSFAKGHGNDALNRISTVFCEYMTGWY
jgi:hypothetical protein